MSGPRDKRCTEEEAVAELRSGMTIGFGGWGSRRKPMSVVRAILRSDLTDLTVVSWGGPDVGLLCAAGKVKRLLYAFVSLDSIPLEPHFRAARQSGAHVIAVDRLPARLETARAHGAQIALNAADGSAAEAIKDLTGGRGADVCFEVTGSTVALNEAIRAAAYSARVVAMGFFQGEAQGLRLGEEFHHNRINLVCSQIGGTDPELQYRWNKLRLWQTAIQLQVEGVLDLRTLITHRAPFERAAELYAALDETPDQVLQAVLEFAPESE